MHRRVRLRRAPALGGTRPTYGRTAGPAPRTEAGFRSAAEARALRTRQNELVRPLVIHRDEPRLGAVLHDVGELAELVGRQHERVRPVRVAADLLHPADLVAEQGRVAADERLHLFLLPVRERLLERVEPL